MGILDTFTFLLRADSRTAVDNIDEVGEAFDDAREDGERATRDIADNAEDMGGRLSSIAETIKTKFGLELSGGFAALGASIGIAAIAGMGFGDVLERIPELISKVKDAASVGVDITSYDAMSRVFERNGVEADGFRDTMIDLNEAMGEAAADAESGKAQSFKTFGISLKDAAGNAKNADQVLTELSASMEKMTKQEATFQIKALGITDNAVIQTLLLGNKALTDQIELQKQKFALTEKDQDQLLELNQSQNMLNATVSAMVDQFAVMLVPALTAVTAGTRVLIEFILEHKRVIGIAAGVITTLLLPALWNTVTATASWAAATLIATWPILAIGAAVAALILVIDDLWSYYEGGDSVIGGFAEKNEMLRDVLAGLKTMAEGLMQFFTDMWNNPEKALTDFQGFMHTVWTNMVSDTKLVFTELWNWIVNIFKNIGSAVSDGIKSAASGAYDSLPGWAKKGLGAVGLGGDGDLAENHPLNEARVPAAAANVTVGAASSSPQIPSGAGRVSNVNITNAPHVDKIEVNSNSSDPAQVAQAVPKALSDHFQDAAQHYSSGRSH